MPKTKNNTTLNSLPVVDLAYAVERLVAAGKTTTAEVAKLASERGMRIAILEAELKALQQGGLVAVPAASPAPRRAAKRPKPAAKAPAPKAKESAKRVASRKLQGKYIGSLRNFSGAERERIRGLAKAKGFGAAIAEMTKLRAAKPVAAKKVAVKKAAKPLPAKKPVPKARKPKIDLKRAAALKLQGRYIGMLSTRPEAEKAKLKALAKKKGFAAAIEVMRKGSK